MKISIIIPIYNSVKNLSRCLDSVLAQTYSNIEIILVNDGSTDGSQALCEWFAKEDSRITLINQENKGPAAARNAGIKIATGNYIGFVDSDDFIECEMYENLNSSASNSNADIIISNIKVDNNEKFSVLNNNLPKNEILDTKKIKEFVLSGYFNNKLGNISSLVNKLYKSSFLKSNNILIDETRVRAEDYWFNFYSFSKADTCIALDYAGYTYKVCNEGSVMKTFRENQFEGFLRTRKELLFNNKDLNFKINYSIWDTEFINNTNEFILMALRKNRLDVVKKILKDEEFRKAMQNFKALKIHTKLIKIGVNYKFNWFAYIVYYSWSKKI